MSWLEARFDLSSPVFWLFISTAIAILATNVAWLVAHLSAQRPPSTGLRWLRSDAVRAAAWLLASLWLLVLPFYAWRYAAISPALLGIAEIDWAESLGIGGLFAGLIIALTVFGWLVYRHILPACADADVRDSRLLLALAAAAEAGLLQWHLAFYRAALIAWLSASEALPGSLPTALLHAAQSQSFYWGSWLGLALILAEAGLNPFVRDALATPSVAEIRRGRPEALLRTLALLIATTALFLLTRNFWLSLACHIVVNTAIAGWLPLHRPARPEVLDA